MKLFYNPPLISNIEPVIYLFLSNKKYTKSLISSGLPNLFNGILSIILFNINLSIFFVILVSIYPGHIQFTNIFLLAFSSESDLVNPNKADFELA